MASNKRFPDPCFICKAKNFKKTFGALFVFIIINLIVIFLFTSNVKQNWTVLDYSRNSFVERLSQSRSKFSNESLMIRTSLVVCVPSQPSNHAERIAIRQTRAYNKQNSETMIIFFVGTKKLNYTTHKRITQEREKYEDLIFLENFKDTYEDLTLKVIQIFEWVHNNIIFDYVMKVDEDTFVRLDEVLKELESKPTEGLYWGYFNENSEIVRKGKWAETKPYICDKYVAYALGGGYVLSKDLVQYISQNSDKLKKFVNEDVSVGTWLAPLETNSIDDKRFRMKGQCEEKYIVLHCTSIDDMIKFNQSLLTNGILCGETAKVAKIKEENTDTTTNDSQTVERKSTAKD